jgi:uncharacterized protein (DUF934 family)
LQLQPDVDAPAAWAAAGAGVEVIELTFPKFTDGRAFSQAVMLRRRAGFKGTLRATGDVLVDQLLQMRRTGFTEAVLKEGQDLAHGEKLLTLYADFYQGDAQQPRPHFARSTR